MIRFTLPLIPVLCFALAACQQAPPPSTPTGFSLRPVKARDVVFRGKYYAMDKVDVPIRPPDFSKFPIPRYPAELRRAGVEGMIHLAVAIDEKGNVAEVETFAATDERFAASAKEAILKWKFRPARKDGRAVAVWSLLPIRFKLGDVKVDPFTSTPRGATPKGIPPRSGDLSGPPKGGIDGLVRVKISVDERGYVERAEIVSATDPRLADPAILETVKKWKFNPVAKNGLNVKREYILPIRFTGKGKPYRGEQVDSHPARTSPN